MWCGLGFCVFHAVLVVGYTSTPLLPISSVMMQNLLVGQVGRLCEGAGVRGLLYLFAWGFFFLPLRWRFGSLSLSRIDLPSLIRHYSSMDLWFIQFGWFIVLCVQVVGTVEREQQKGLWQNGCFFFGGNFFPFMLCCVCDVVGCVCAVPRVSQLITEAISLSSCLLGRENGRRQGGG
ncbi:hypothetical protein F4809DRAFT_380491 [Biscogniauxia mediterranea]|nr:hypothetical protein F4809DRAFT_380491 [Biscogniauxia mediterranea]